MMVPGIQLSPPGAPTKRSLTVSSAAVSRPGSEQAGPKWIGGPLGSSRRTSHPGDSAP
jgi:hypothetical protein